MAWQKGQTGNPNGARSRRLISGDIEKELLKNVKDGNVTKARRIAEQVVNLAVDGDKWAVQFVTERTEGRPDQPISIIREVRELSDGELANIAASGSTGIADETRSAQVTSSVH